MLSSKCIFTILVTIALTITYKPCKSINSTSQINETKLSFLQRRSAGLDTPESVKTGETVEVASNKDVYGKSSGTSEGTSVDSHTNDKEVKQHDQGKQSTENNDKEEKQSTESHGEVKHESDANKENHDTENSNEVVKNDNHGTTSQSENTKEKVDSADSHAHGNEDEPKEESESTVEDHHEHKEEEEVHSVSHSDQESEESKNEEQKESGGSEKQPEPSASHDQNGVESKETEAEVHTHNQQEQKQEEKAETTSDQGGHNQDTSDASHGSENEENKESSSSQGADDHSSHSGESQEEASEHQVTSENNSSSQEEHKTTEANQELTHTTADVSAHTPTQVSCANHVDTTPVTQPSTSTQSVVTSHVTPVNQGDQTSQETGTSVVQHQSSLSQSSTAPPTAPGVVDLNSLTDSEKKTVVDFWSKPSGDCSLDCSHSCKSELGGTTQCVNATATSLSCSTFNDSSKLTCPEGYTPCTQPSVTALKSYTLKNGGVEVGALEVDGSNFNKCMGLVLTTLDGTCDKEHLVGNLLFTSTVVNLDYEINVAADKLTFSNLKMKNGDYKVCVFQRHEGSLEGMTLSNLWNKLVEFINPTSSTPSETKTVFVLNVGTLKVSD